MSIVLKSGCLNLETLGPVQACNGIVTNRFLPLRCFSTSLLWPHCKLREVLSHFLDDCPQLRLVCARSYVLKETSLLGYAESTGKWSPTSWGCLLSPFSGSLDYIGYENGDLQALRHVGNYIYQPALRRVL